MAHIAPYLSMAGKANEAVAFYARIFGGTPTVTLGKDSPMEMAPGTDDLVFHADLTTPAGLHILLSDMSAPDQPTIPGNNIGMGLMCDSEDQLRSWYDQLSAGGDAGMAPSAAPWGAVYGDCTDKYGIHWMLNYDIPTTV